jgi:hypothetical protein
MLGTELSYVREKLAGCTPEERNALAKVVKVHPKTLRRIVSKKTLAPGSDTVGKIAMHFRTQEKRRK